MLRVMWCVRERGAQEGEVFCRVRVELREWAPCELGARAALRPRAEQRHPDVAGSDLSGLCVRSMNTRKHVAQGWCRPRMLEVTGRLGGGGCRGDGRACGPRNRAPVRIPGHEYANKLPARVIELCTLYASTRARSWKSDSRVPWPRAIAACSRKMASCLALLGILLMFLT